MATDRVAGEVRVLGDQLEVAENGLFQKVWVTPMVASWMARLAPSEEPGKP